MTGGKKIKCAYPECMLPESNTKYLIQIFYLSISILFLFKSSSDFTFFAILMYSAPVLLDLAYSGMKGVVWGTIKFIFIVLNGVVVSLCFLGLFGVLIDADNSFEVVETALLFPGVSIEKKELVIPMFFELLVPVSMYIGSPTKNTKKAVEFVLAEGKR